MKLNLTTWNINSVRARSHLVMNWLNNNPDCTVLGLQEIKCEDEQFPQDFKKAGFHVYTKGQKAYNGVALISRSPLKIINYSLPDFDYEEARYIEANLDGKIIICIYLPNGNSGGKEGLQKKIAFLKALYKRAKELRETRTPFVIMGDYNICPTPLDLSPGILPDTDALVLPVIKDEFYALEWLGLTDAYRSLHPSSDAYTFWDYQAGAFQRNKGLRIDHFLLSPSFTEALTKVTIDKDERKKEKPSDHVPVIAEFDFS